MVADSITATLTTTFIIYRVIIHKNVLFQEGCSYVVYININADVIKVH